MFKQILLLLFIIPSIAFAQNLPVKIIKTSYVDSLNRYYHNLYLPAYMHLSFSGDVAPTQISTKNYSTKKNPMAPFYFNKHGLHRLKYYTNEKDRTQRVNFDIYADGYAPITKAVFDGAAPYKSKKGKVYYPNNLSVEIEAYDDMSGVSQTFVSVNKVDYTDYEGTLNFDSEGEYTLKYLSSDNVGNVEKAHKKVFTIDTAAPNTYHNILGLAEGNVISTKTKIYLTKEDNLSGVSQTFYQIDKGPWVPYKRGLIPLAKLTDGDHLLNYYSVDHVRNREESGEYEFYLDRISPIMAADIIGDKFIVGDKIYFSGRTRMKLTAVDNKSGVKKVLFAIDKGKYGEYKDPFYLPSKVGQHTIKYYAIDKMANKGTGSDGVEFEEYQHNSSVVYVDLLGPKLDFAFEGSRFKKGRTTFINNDTKIRLIGSDGESGLKKLSYSINGAETEIDYGTPFQITDQGNINLRYFGYDNVNNKNAKKTYFVIDNQGPEIIYNFSIAASKDGEQELYPSYTVVYLAATDDRVGNDYITYSVNGGKEILYKGGVKGFQKNKNYLIKIKAVDKLGNKSEEEISFNTDKY